MPFPAITAVTSHWAAFLHDKSSITKGRYESVTAPKMLMYLQDKLLKEAFKSKFLMSMLCPAGPFYYIINLFFVLCVCSSKIGKKW